MPVQHGRASQGTLKRMENLVHNTFILFYTEEEVENANDDNKNCLKQAVIETSKSPSVSQPDSFQRSLGFDINKPERSIVTFVDRMSLVGLRS
ncbi:hypothetical protein Bca52824_022642 [Brassica carinata]|uniref:Uncharacterized protein n=1 Tax=Brassica carinata TaxID=52824 RepID=A0A8X7VHG8_BRACI|nr:hypothetical protein Bca52824_022642 [Brassica carinata]